jgi:hypothetical protein
VKTIYSSFFIFLFLASCKPIAPTTENTSNNKRYAFGKGGGFTGAFSEYILEENGKVYKYDFKYDREVFIKDLEKVDLNYFLEQIEKLGLDGIDINEPGNMSFYIDIRVGKSSMNKITWGANLYYAPNELIKFHKEIFDHLSKIE